MKRKACILLLSLCVACTAAGCGGKGDSASENSASGVRLVSVTEKKMDDYVKLGGYKGIIVENAVMDVTDEDVDYQLENTMSMSAEEVEDPETQIEDGDIANIDYEGKKDGVAFDGGTAQDYDLSIGSGQFIDGFEDGLIGAKKGETRDLNLTFPEDYNSEELAGQEVVFTVTVNAIKRVPELTEEWVTANSEYDSIDAYRQSVREDLEESNEEMAESTLKNTAWNQVLTDSEITEYPDEDLKAAKEEYNDSMNSYAEQMGQSVEEFLKAQGITQEDVEEDSQQYAENKIKQNLIVQAIMDKEGFTMEDEDAKKAEEQMESDYGMTIEEMNEQYGEAAVKETLALTRIMDFIVDNAKVEGDTDTSDEEDVVDTDEEDAGDEEKAEE